MTPTKPLVGYSDRISARPGETVRVMVSCELDAYDARLVRLGADEQPVASGVDGRHAGTVQPLRHGSYVLVPGFPLAALGAGFTLAAHVFPTTAGARDQALLTSWSATGAGLGLYLSDGGELELRIGRDGDAPIVVSSGVRLRDRHWYFAAATYDARTATARVRQWPQREGPFDPRAEVERDSGPSAIRSDDVPFVIAAEQRGTEVSSHFNGKLEAPVVFARALSDAEFATVAGRPEAARSMDGVVAAWSFGEDFAGTDVADRGPNGLSGVAVNAPTRAVTGREWSGATDAFASAPDQYAAIHFHDDDLEDAGWEVSLALELPDAAASGVYAVKLTADGHEDYVPFFVRGARDGPRAPLLFLAPTFSYLAYQNHHNGAVGHAARASQPEDEYSTENRILTLYERHSDGSGVCYASYLRPLGVPRPKYRSRFTGAVHQLSADLQLVRWLEQSGFAYEVATDHDLHLEGAELLDGHRALVTGSHPEYWSGEMLDAVETFLADGGRLAYLGGNGFYWVTSMNPERPHLVEVRRGDGGVRTWTSEPGEAHHSTTGERGGLWRYRGRAPQRLCGVGFTAWGGGGSGAYQRLPDSFDERAAFIFEGVGDDEPIGVDGDVLGGAAGYEVDRADPHLGTPAHALVVAACLRHDVDFYPCPEDLEIADFPLPEAPDDPRVRTDMVFFETPNGGAVFSTGSIAWSGALAADEGRNPVSRITANVLRRFCAEGGGG